MKTGIICSLDERTSWKKEFPDGTCYVVTDTAYGVFTVIDDFKKRASHKVAVASHYPHVVMFEHEEDAVLWKLSY